MSGHYGYHYDKHLEHQDQTTLGKIQQQYWTTKQHVIQKLGKKEDEFVVLSDAELDAKLELFRAIKQNSNDLMRIIELYQEKLCQLSNEEAEMAAFLKEFSQYDKTRAGKMMSSVAKAQNFSSQQRLSLRLPLARLFNEVETFRYRAITDTWLNIRKMETARTEYRGALLWMRNISEELDPDTFKKLEKFRRVQSQVKTTKTKFDRVKNDVIQKVDLLLASRCNMFSHVLVLYQHSLINFWMKTAKTMNAIADAFKGYQYYEFNIIKDLVEPSKKLAELANTSKEDDSESTDNEKKQVQEEKPSTLIEFDENAEKKDEDNDEDFFKRKDSMVNQGGSAGNFAEVDEVNNLIDMMTSNDAQQLSEQLKEFELLQKLKQKNVNETKKQQQQQQQLAATGSEFDYEIPSAIDENLFKNTNDEFEKEWQSAFSTPPQQQHQHQQIPQSSSATLISELKPSTDFFKTFLPSQLLSTSPKAGGDVLQPVKPTQQPVKPPPTASKGKKDMSTWYNLFADLDPLQNPDAIGEKEEVEEQRNC